jgi:hypothetical protein
MQNLELRDNSSRELIQAADYMYRRTQPAQAKPKNLQNAHNNLALELKVPESSSKMSTPAFFQSQLFHSFDNSAEKTL